MLQFKFLEVVRPFSLKTVTLQSQFCPKCLVAKASKEVDADWEGLLKREEVQVEQVLNALSPNGEWKRGVLNLRTPSTPCQECQEACVVCLGPVEAKDRVDCDGYKAAMHRACGVKCHYKGCFNYLPGVPRYFIPKILTVECGAHGKKAPPVVVPKIIRPVVIPKNVKPNPVKTRLEKFKKEAKAPSVLDFYGTKEQREKITTEPKESKRHLCRSDGTPYAFKRDGKWYKMRGGEETDEPLFDEEPLHKKTKFDFTPPSGAPGHDDKGLTQPGDAQVQQP